MESPPKSIVVWRRERERERREDDDDLIGKAPSTQPTQITIFTGRTRHTETDWGKENKNTDDEAVQESMNRPLDGPG